MKKILSILLFVVLSVCTVAQVPSSCVTPQLLAHEYERDIKNMVIRRLFQVHSPDTGLVQIPHSWQDTISEGLSAIFNATSIPERDTIFNLYCVHDNTTPLQTYTSLLIEVNSSYPWTQAWQNLTSITGNPLIDSMMVRYDLHVDNFYNWGIGNYALLSTDSLWNCYALADSFETVPGIIHGEPNTIFGSAGKIVYNQMGNSRYYDFYFEFSDCFDGCDNFRDWQFKVNSDCSVEYLGSIDWGYFGILPLPAPLNCNTFTSIHEHGLNIDAAFVYPNPASDYLKIHISSSEYIEQTVSILTILGQVISHIEIKPAAVGEIELDVRNLPPGFYLCQIQYGSKTLSLKFIKD